MRSDAIKCENIKDNKTSEIGKLKEKIQLIQEDRRFLYINAKDEKQRANDLQKNVEDLNTELEELRL